ncbi:two-component regulator propeller domain-containing protein [Aestuariivivens sediminicola]|uniref:type IX secretion system anionic LPS delivery protein PorZ n=1 Tax=Aestuariivivens sediminicola TaxID=2913560 RepID=UPI001F5647CE|nr:two-component regulator propeller domain-containing protein [Aestuariivivens sediminicola]
MNIFEFPKDVMCKRFFLLIGLITTSWLWAQDFSGLWEGHFSYYNVSQVVKGNNKIYAATENAVFSYDTQTSALETITTINGLSGQTISTISYSEAYELLIIGYVNGLIEIRFDNDDEVLSVVDIIEKPTIIASNRRINHFNIDNNWVYIATDYGISVYDLERLEFGDTYFIGSSGEQIQVSQTTISGDYIYASCLGGNGIRKALVNDSNIIDFNNWQTVSSGNFVAIKAAFNQLYAISLSRRIYSITNDVLSELFLYPDVPSDMTFVDDYLIVTTTDSVYVYNDSFQVVAQISDDPMFATDFTSAVIEGEYLYIGTTDYGMLRTLVQNPLTFEEIRPEGPLLNNPFALLAGPNGLWTTYGEHNIFLNPYPLNSRGLSYLQDEQWHNIPFSELLGARCLKQIAVNPLDNNQAFIGSYFDGLLEINDTIPTFLYDENNSGLDDLVLPSNPSYTGDLRLSCITFDSSGLLWSLTNFVDPALKVFNPSSNSWQSYSIEAAVELDNNGYSDLVIGNDGTKWIATYEYGLAAFNENNNGIKAKSINRENGNLPNDYVTALALDNRGTLWIGTFAGLRVLYNTSNFFEDETVQTNDIIILEDGIAKELLFQQQITDIKVDGSNNKWVGTGNSGVFYFSSDGQQTIFHFTTDNSPLPSNIINDISIDNTSGIVYIATSRGLVSFQSGGSSPLEDLQSAYAYPNPVRPQFDIVEQKVKIKDISENVNIKITDIEGNLVAEAQSRRNLRYNGYNLEIDGGTAYWNGKNLANNVVASGVYLIMLSDLDTFETKVLKLMVVR